MATRDHKLGDVLERLFQTIETRKGADPESSYTASLMAAGPLQCAKKLGEEAVETALAGAAGDKGALTVEAADLLYHLLVLMGISGVSLDDVGAALAAREGVSGHAEKAARD